MAVGIGFDVHQLVPGRKLVLGGVEIPHKAGLLGHSDADVLAHALMDALLGAAGLGDIGRHFPDTDPQYKEADSIRLLFHVMELVRDKGYRFVQGDATILAQEPKLNPHFQSMKKRLSEAMGVAETALNLKASTTEHLGFVGREEGMAALVVVQLEEIP